MHKNAKDRAFVGELCSRVRHARRVAGLTQAQLAEKTGTGASAVAQWESPHGTSPTVEHLITIAKVCGVAFEWLATGRGEVGVAIMETSAVNLASFTVDESEDRLLVAYRRIPVRKRELFVRWLEEFF